MDRITTSRAAFTFCWLVGCAGVSSDDGEGSGDLATTGSTSGPAGDGGGDAPTTGPATTVDPPPTGDGSDATDSSGDGPSSSDDSDSGDPDPPPIVGGCDGNSFAFGVFSDNYSGQEGGLSRVLSELADIEDLLFVTSAGDTPTFERIRDVLDDTLDPDGAGGPCDAPNWPWFPSTGNHDAEVAENMAWWAEQWASPWGADAAGSPLAVQLPGLSDFSAGPGSVVGPDGPLDTDDGTIFSFDFKGAHFVFVNEYAQGIISDSAAGVWDNNEGEDATDSQLDWLRDDLEAHTGQPTFVFGHVALLAPCYNYEPPSSYYDCPGPPPPGWSEHNSNFHTEALTALLAEHDVVAYFHGHDHVPARMLIDADRNAVYERKYWEVANDPAGAMTDPGPWEDVQGPGHVWQVDAGRIYTPSGTYVVVHVNPYEVTFELYVYGYDGDDMTRLWDTWTMELPA